MYKYIKYLPKDYDNNESKYPVIIFLHGAPQRGSDIRKLREEALPGELEKGLEIPCIVIAPHCPKDEIWASQRLYDLMNYVKKKYRVNEKKIYLTGFSMGGFGILKLLRDYPGLFAAAVPICAGGSKFFAEELSSVPIWFFHGTKDEVIKIENTQELVNELKLLNANVKFTIYPELGHEIWPITYKNKEIYDWLLNF